MKQFILDEMQKLSALLASMQKDASLLKTLETISKACIDALKNGRKILFIGNGGSAADSQHLAAELVSRLQFDRPGLPALALTTDTSALTAIGNDYSFEEIFARQVQAVGQKGDVLIGISTSGKSKNILRALDVARENGLICIGFTGMQAPLLQERCLHVLNIPSSETQKIQEGHIVLGHILCALIEAAIFADEYGFKQAKIAELL